LKSASAEKALVFIFARGEGYARGIARFFASDPDSIQKTLVNLEAGGVLISKQAGRTLLYQFNPRYPFRRELEALLAKALSYYPESQREQLTADRRRPRRRGKPL
jgi:hypothetical protein